MNTFPQHRILTFLMTSLVVGIMAGCSSTSAIPDDEQLFTGLKPIKYENYEANSHATATQEEMEFALASAPTGALFGSSYYRTPIPVRLWIWNAFSQDSSLFSRWMTKAFGSRPKLMSQVRPELRTLVAENQLKKFGYFHGKVSSEVLTLSNPKKAKVAYTVNMGPLWRLDTVEYLGYPEIADTLLQKHQDEVIIKGGDPFSVPNLESERQRITKLLRNNGFYYYENGDASYLADTLAVPGKVRMKFLLADSISPRSMKQWYVGNININFKRNFTDELHDSLHRRTMNLRFNGRRPPIRLGVLMHDITLRSKQLYSVENETTTRQKLTTMGLFNYTNLTFTPRDGGMDSDTLDANFDLVFDKPYDFYIETNAKGKTSGRVGPELVMGMTKRNAFRGGEKLDINLHGSYEWNLQQQSDARGDAVNSYEYGADASLVFPRIILPGDLLRKRSTMGNGQRTRNRRKWYRRVYGDATTTLKTSMNILNRAGYFKRHVVSGELTYAWSTSAQSHHSLSPLVLSYEYMNSRTQKFDSVLSENPYLEVSMRDQFVPKMSYTYLYTSPATCKNPIGWETTVSEAGNILNAGYSLLGKKWGTKDKQMFKNPFAQFFKVETDFVKTWRLSQYQSLVGHVNAGAIFSYGNATQAPYYEQFYVGGANSIRAFNVRTIGPGRYQTTEGRSSYIDQTGDIKLVMNLEYRPRLWGDLYGAVFLDAGNVWTTHHDQNRPGGKFDKNFLEQMAFGTGVGIRYDLDMFVIRVDWGIGLHLPYDTGKSGLYNVSSFRDAQSLHLAVGYPF